MMRLAALIPIAMAKGGRAGVAGLLGGFQRAQQHYQQTAQQQGEIDWRQNFQQQQLERQNASEDRLADSAAATERDRRLQQQRQFLEQVGTLGGNPELTPEEHLQRLEAFARQAPQYGLSQVDVEQASYVAPTRREKAQLTRMLADVDKMYPATEERENLKLANGMTVGEARQKLAGASGPAPVVRPPATSSDPDKALEAEWYDPKTTPERRAEISRLRSGFAAQTRAPGGGGGVRRELTDTARANVIGSRRTQWSRISKAVVDRQVAVAKVDAGVSALNRGNRNAATQIIIMAFNKLLDETSVVREGEYARSESLAPIISKVEGALARFVDGGASLTNQELLALANEAKATAQAMEAVTAEAVGNFRQSVEEELGDYGIPTSRVFGGSQIGKPKPPAPDPSAAGAAPTAPPGWKYVPKAGGGWTAVRSQP
jgi:hypothetical protein